MKALVLLAEGFEEIEGLTPVDYMRRAGIEVVTAGVCGTKKIIGGHGIIVAADTLLEDVNEEDFAVVVLPGGMGGMTRFRDSELVRSILKKRYAEGRKIAAICASPSIFGDLGFVKGRKCTCYPGFENHMVQGVVLPDKAVVDGHVITGKGAGAAQEFAFTLIEEVLGKAKAMEVAASVQY